MNSKEIIGDKFINNCLLYSGFNISVDEGRLMLSELLLKAAAGYYNSHTEELFLKSALVCKRDRTPNKVGRKFLCELMYTHSNYKPECYYLMERFRKHNPTIKD